MIYRYKGRNNKGEIEKGVIEGNNRKEIILSLKKKKITLIYLKIEKSKKNSFKKIKDSVLNNINNFNFTNIFNNKNKNTQNDINEILSKYQQINNKKKSTENISDLELENQIKELLNQPITEEVKVDKSSFDIKDIFTQDIKILRDNYKSMSKTKTNKSNKLFQSKKVNKKDVMMFAKQLSILLESGVALTKSLQIIYEQTQSQYFKKVLTMITANVIRGYSLSDSLINFPKIFDNYFITMVKTGEQTGELSFILNLLYEHMFEKQRIKKKITNALIYPAFIGVVLLIGLILFTFKIVPQFKVLFDGIPLPFITLALFGFFDFVSKNFIYIVLFIIGLIFMYKLLCNNNYFLYKRDEFILKIPFLGKVLLNYQVVNIIETLVICLNTGITLPNSLGIVIENTTNSFLKYKLDIIRNGVIDGVSMTSNLNSMDIFPFLFKQMIKIGEDSGKLNVTLDKAKTYYTWELENFINNIDKWFEPVTILLIAVFVVIFVLAVFLPILDISSGSSLQME